MSVALPCGVSAGVVDGDGGAVRAGFWNSHVHFTEPKWAGAADLPAPRLQSQLREMLVRYGFTSVVDTGSDPRDTGPLRARIESGEIAGPRIITAMSPLFPPDGVPRSEEHTSELPSLMRISYAVFCLKTKTHIL